MKTRRLAALGLLLCAAAHRAPSLEAAEAPLAITNVTVIDTTGGPARLNMTVVVEGDRISRVQRTGARVPRGARRIDGTGKFLIPGLWDMHIHTFFGDWVPGGREVTLPLFVANGVTGVRDTST
jgi:adenine deaminase